MRRREPTATALSDAEMSRRATWGDLLPDVPKLTIDERAEWAARCRASGRWVPQRALNYCWDHCDHGAEPWSLPAFMDALTQDDVEIADVMRQHREQADRLAAWRTRIETLAHERDRETDAVSCGRFFVALIALGYDGAAAAVADDETAHEVMR